MSDRRLAPASRPPNFLAGPADRLSLSWPAALALIAFGTLLSVLSLIGRSDWVAQLPGVVSAQVAALAIALLAARWFGGRTAVVAGTIQCTVGCMLRFLPPAENDLHLVAAVTVAMSCFAAANIDSPAGRSNARWLPWVFAVAAGLALEVAGPLGLALILAGCVPLVLINQDLRALRFFVDPVALGLLAVCVLLYVWQPAPFDVDYAPDRRMLFSRLLQIPLATLPWFPLLPLYLWRRRGEGLLVLPLWRFVLCWFGFGLIVVALSASRSLSIGPVLPGLSILLALALVDLAQRRPSSRRLLAHLTAL